MRVLLTFVGAAVDDSSQLDCALGANSYVREPVEFAKSSAAVKALVLYWRLLNETPSPRRTRAIEPEAGPAYARRAPLGTPHDVWVVLSSVGEGDSDGGIDRGDIRRLLCMHGSRARWASGHGVPRGHGVGPFDVRPGLYARVLSTRQLQPG